MGEPFLRSRFVLGVEELPAYKTVPTTIYRFRFDGLPMPKHHWMFCGEIVDDEEASNKKANNRLVVRDRNGVECLVWFFYEKDAPVTFKWKELQKGCTILIMYGEKDELEGKKGVRVDALDYCYVLGAPLEKCIEASKCVSEDVIEAGNEQRKEEKEGEKLLQTELNSIQEMCKWERFEDKFYPFQIRENLPVHDDFFGKGNIE